MIWGLEPDRKLFIFLFTIIICSDVMGLEIFAAAAILIWVNHSYISKFVSDENKIGLWTLRAGTVAVALVSLIGLTNIDGWKMASYLFFTEGMTVGFALLASWIFKGKKMIERGLDF